MMMTTMVGKIIIWTMIDLVVMIKVMIKTSQMTTSTVNKKWAKMSQLFAQRWYDSQHVHLLGNFYPTVVG